MGIQVSSFVGIQVYGSDYVILCTGNFYNFSLSLSLQAMQLASPGYGQLVPRLNFLMQGFLLSMIGEAGDPPGWSVVAFRS